MRRRLSKRWLAPTALVLTIMSISAVLIFGNASSKLCDGADQGRSSTTGYELVKRRMEAPAEHAMLNHAIFTLHVHSESPVIVRVTAWLFREEMLIARFPWRPMDELAREGDDARFIFLCVHEEYVPDSTLRVTILDAESDDPIESFRVSLSDAKEWSDK